MPSMSASCEQDPCPNNRVAQPSDSLAIPHLGLRSCWTINPPSEVNIWVLTMTECYTKWVEAIALSRATGLAVVNFIRDNLFCRFEIMKRTLSDNGMPFINSNVRELCEKGVDHIKSTSYYPQGNRQAESTNKTLIRTLSRIVYNEPK